MATLSDVQTSMNTSGSRKKKDENHELAVELAKSGKLASSKFENKTGFKIYKLIDRRPKVYLDAISEGVKPDTGKRMRIYCLNGAPSIWQDELKDLLLDKTYVSMNRREIVFHDGVLRVEAKDTLLIEFLENSVHFVGDNPSNRRGGKFDFFEYNPKRIEEERLKREEKEIQVIVQASKLDDAQAKKIASYLGIPIFDEYGFPATPDGIKTSVIRWAKANPDNFLNLVDNKDVETHSMIFKAIQDSLIGEQEGGVVEWSKTKAIIGRKGSGITLKDYLMGLATSHSDEGKAFLEQLKIAIK
jgi:hypothetical protein